MDSVREKYPDFASDPRNQFLSLKWDGVEVIGRSIWPFVFYCLNLGLAGNDDKFSLMATAMEGAQGKCPTNFQARLEFVLEDLLMLWRGVTAIDASRNNETFTLRAMLVFWSSDLQGLIKVLRLMGPNSHHGLDCCGVKARRLDIGNKMIVPLDVTEQDLTPRDHAEVMREGGFAETLTTLGSDLPKGCRRKGTFVLAHLPYIDLVLATIFDKMHVSSCLVKGGWLKFIKGKRTPKLKSAISRRIATLSRMSAAERTAEQSRLLDEAHVYYERWYALVQQARAWQITEARRHAMDKKYSALKDIAPAHVISSRGVPFASTAKLRCNAVDRLVQFRILPHMLRGELDSELLCVLRDNCENLIDLDRCSWSDELVTDFQERVRKSYRSFSRACPLSEFRWVHHLVSEMVPSIRLIGSMRAASQYDLERKMGSVTRMVHDHAAPIENLFEMARLHSMTVKMASEKELEAFCKRYPVGRGLWKRLQNARKSRKGAIWLTELRRRLYPGEDTPWFSDNIVGKPVGLTAPNSIAGAMRVLSPEFDQVYISWWVDWPFPRQAGVSDLEVMAGWKGWSGEPRMKALFQQQPSVSLFNGKVAILGYERIGTGCSDGVALACRASRLGFTCFEIREEDYELYRRCVTAYPGDDPIQQDGRFRFGQIEYFARVTLGNGLVLEMAKVFIFTAPRPDEIHEFPTFSPRTCKDVRWIGVNHIGKPVIVESLSGDPADRRRGPLTALGCTMTWQVHEVGGPPAELPPAQDRELELWVEISSDETESETEDADPDYAWL